MGLNSAEASWRGVPHDRGFMLQMKMIQDDPLKFNATISGPCRKYNLFFFSFFPLLTVNGLPIFLSCSFGSWWKRLMRKEA